MDILVTIMDTSLLLLLIIYGPADVYCSLPVDLASEEKGIDTNLIYEI